MLISPFQPNCFSVHSYTFLERGEITLMAVGNAIDFAYFRYTADDGSHWSVKCDTDWGANAQSGLAAFNAADPLWPSSGRYRARKCLLQDATSTRKTSRVLGTAAATAGVPGTAVVTVAR